MLKIHSHRSAGFIYPHHDNWKYYIFEFGDILCCDALDEPRFYDGEKFTLIRSNRQVNHEHGRGVVHSDLHNLNATLKAHTLTNLYMASIYCNGVRLRLTVNRAEAACIFNTAEQAQINELYIVLDSSMPTAFVPLSKELAVCVVEDGCLLWRDEKWHTWSGAVIPEVDMNTSKINWGVLVASATSNVPGLVMEYFYSKEGFKPWLLYKHTCLFQYGISCNPWSFSNLKVNWEIIYNLTR